MESHALTAKARAQLDNILARDAAWCRKRLSEIQRRLKRGQAADRLLNQVLQRIERSGLKVEQRRAGLPRPVYPEELPITQHRNEILESIGEHQVVIVAGETGSGKTTQLPKFCLQAGRGTRGLIACTQPRRIAARAMAERVAEELQSKLGGFVGYQVRFRERSSPEGYIKFMTDGILLAESLTDRYLDAYDTIIIDEAHERSLNIDFLLGYLKSLLPKRPDLKLLITSATIDTGKFSRHFGDAPVIEVSGRGYPVECVYQPLSEESDKSERADRDLYQGIADAVRRLGRIDPRGDILVFLSGEREIREAGDFLQRQSLRGGSGGTEILPLYARLSAAEQRRVFHPGSTRRIILSTNVAETSLTVPGIRFVVDSGLARISRYSHRSRIQRLPIEPISQASANQRAGRCGRLGPGTCVRLYSEEDFASRPEFTEPEILRTSLASVILRMLTMGLGSVEDFPFVDRPAPRMINDAYQLLFELEAIDEDRCTTNLGKSLARWPLDVRLARMVEAGSAAGCLEDMMVLASALSIQDPRERPLEAQAAADEAHRRFADDKSDFATLLELWRYLKQKRKEFSGNQFRKLCRREFLNWQRVLEWFDVYQQLRDQAREDRRKLSGHHGDFEQVHQCLLAGLLSHCGRKHPEDPGYTGTRSSSYHIFPGSGLFGSSPQWLMSAEIVETSKPYARINAAIRPEWIERQGSHLLKRHYSAPHWSRRKGAVYAWEQVSLYGMVIVEKRRVNYGPIDPPAARRIFIMEALVRGELDTRAAFREHNRKIRAEVELLEHKRRKRDVLVDEQTLYEFFDARIPERVTSAKSFEKWLSGLEPEKRDLLYLGHDVLMQENAGAAPREQFPDQMESGGRTFSLGYHFDPGSPDDGVQITVPLVALNTLQPGRLEWLVPGLLRDKLVALIRQLPKPLRRSLTPVPEFADALMASIQHRAEEPMLEVCADELQRMTGLPVAAEDLDENSIDDHFRFLVTVVNDSGETIDSGRDLAAIQERLGSTAQRSFMDQQGEAFNRDGETQWVFGSLSSQIQTEDGATAWPALVDQGDAAGLRLFDTWDEAVLSHIDGVLRLVRLAIPDKMNYLEKHHGLSRDALLAWSALGSADQLVRDVLRQSLADCAGDISMVRDADSFSALCQLVRNKIGNACRQRATLLNEVLLVYSKVARQINRRLEGRLPGVFEDVSAQLEDLIYPGFLSDLEPGRLEHYPRYLQAVEERLLQLEQDPVRDAGRMASVAPWWDRYRAALEGGCLYDEAMDTFRWLIEEYRVSLFAQRLGTAERVSEKRLADAWEKTGC
ncbi:MAG: ATP-dependent RNA helicase HrpA [Xanthomonadales bacterium]|nr:ATP-dependent RNA helicase HrpA [Gammaproteobacteria bacterium]NNK52665.1 ATP-dependent RNA helicase HrpA [Xanthomonadales bacterium]